MNNDIENLLDELTQEEKIALLAGADAWHTVAIPRLGIPALKLSDGPNGVRGASRTGKPTSACFPAGIALGATWNAALVERVGQALAEEAQAKGAHILLAPTVNIHRSPLAGRNFECFSEDPLLSGRMAAAYIRGLQSRGVGACIKHFVCNDSEFERFSISSEVGERALREIYLRPFEIAVREAQPWSLMTAYNRVNGVYASEHAELLLGILKQEWGFDGLVLSDWYGTYGEGALGNGLDLEMPGPGRWLDPERVRAALDAGRVDMTAIDDMVRRLLRTVERTGAFRQAAPPAERAEDRAEHRALIREAGAEATVLLRNRGGILPLDLSRLNAIAVIGDSADRPAAMGGGSSAVAPHYLVSPLEGIRRRVGDQAAVAYAVGRHVHRVLPNIDMAWLQRPDGSGPGVQLEYFAGAEPAGAPVHREIVDTLEASWFGDFVAGMSAARFSVRLSTSLAVPESGHYRLGLSRTGLGRLFLDGELLVDHWTGGNPLDLAERSEVLLLEAGRRYRVQVDYSWTAEGNWRGLHVGLLEDREADLLAEAELVAASADVAIVFAGLTAEWESEGFDRPTMSLPAGQDELISRVAAANPNTVVVLSGGSPLSMPWLDQVAGVLWTWYGGQEAGNAVADVLFGDQEPSGRLPTSIPRRLEDNPAYLNYPGEFGQVHYGEGLFVGYRYYDKKAIEPLFPFGFGLSYTTFEYGALRLDAATYAPGRKIRVSVDVTNSGARAGWEVVQLYVQDLEARVLRPEKELVAFAKVRLEPGETRSLRFTLDQDALGYFQPVEGRRVVEPGAYRLLVARSAGQVCLSARFEIAPEPRRQG